jgi:hypothetical protein
MSRTSTSGAVVSLPPTERLDTLPPWPWQDPTDPRAPMTLGFAAAAWTERWLRQPNGPRAGRPFRLTGRQLRWLLWWYALDDDGSWLYGHGVRRLAKGSGKSPFAAVQALSEFCGPVRPARKDGRVAGRVLGRPVGMPWVQIAATAESQTKNTMRMVRAFAARGSEVVEHHGLDPGKTQYYRLPEGLLEVITSSSTAAEGAEASFVVADETEHWTPSAGGPELAAVLEDNLAKSGSRLLQTSNAWVPGRDSVAEATWDGWLAQEEGRTRGTQRILYDAVMAPPDTDLADPDSLLPALRGVYADCPWVDVDAIAQRIWSPRSRPDDSRRKYLNRPSVAADAWADPAEWSSLYDPDGRLADGDALALFFDGSRSRDATALIACRLSDGFVATLGVWEPDPADPMDTVDVSDVDRVVAQTFDRYDPRAFFADVREWEQQTLVAWPERYGDRLQVWSEPNGRPPQSIAWDMRGKSYLFARAAEACHAEIVEGTFRHDGHPVTARHVANARRRPYRDLVSIGKESPQSPRKVDAAVAVIGARMVRRLVLADGGRRARTGRVW